MSLVHVSPKLEQLTKVLHVDYITQKLEVDWTTIHWSQSICTSSCLMQLIHKMINMSLVDVNCMNNNYCIIFSLSTISSVCNFNDCMFRGFCFPVFFVSFYDCMHTCMYSLGLLL